MLRPVLIVAIVAIVILLIAGLEEARDLSTRGQILATSSSNSNRRSNSTSSSNAYALELSDVSSSGSLLSSLTSPQTKTNIANDVAPVWYYNWQVVGDLGDLQPDAAWFSANQSGITLSDQTCSGAINRLDCGPFQKENLLHTGNFTEIGAILNAISENYSIFSIEVSIPFYSFYPSCVFNVSSTGCSYEGTGPMVVANFALNTYREISSNSFSVNVAEVRNGTSNSLAVGWSVSQTLCNVNGCDTDGTYSINEKTEGAFTSQHTLTIVTDRKSSIEMFADGKQVYSNSDVAALLQGSQLSASFYQFTSINNETSSTTWRNFSAFSNSNVSVRGLSPNMSALISGPFGFRVLASPNSSGVATADVSLSPTDLSVSLTENGTTLVTYAGTVNSGASLDFVSQ